jgi:hypothetical protein
MCEETVEREQVQRCTAAALMRSYNAAKRWYLGH